MDMKMRNWSAENSLSTKLIILLTSPISYNFTVISDFHASAKVPTKLEIEFNLRSMIVSVTNFEPFLLYKANIAILDAMFDTESALPDLFRILKHLFCKIAKNTQPEPKLSKGIFTLFW